MIVMSSAQQGVITGLGISKQIVRNIKKVQQTTEPMGVMVNDMAKMSVNPIKRKTIKFL